MSLVLVAAPRAIRERAALLAQELKCDVAFEALLRKVWVLDLVKVEVSDYVSASLCADRAH